MACLAASEMAIYSAPVELWTVTVCFLLFQQTGHSEIPAPYIAAPSAASFGASHLAVEEKEHPEHTALCPFEVDHHWGHIPSLGRLNLTRHSSIYLDYWCMESSVTRLHTMRFGGQTMYGGFFSLWKMMFGGKGDQIDELRAKHCFFSII